MILIFDSYDNDSYDIICKYMKELVIPNVFSLELWIACSLRK